MPRKIPVLLAGDDCLSGVTTWARLVRATLAGHPRYDIKLLSASPAEAGDADLVLPGIEAAQREIRRLAPVIVVPNYVWELCMTGRDPGVYCVGMCHADSEDQYYSPLSWFEPFIAKFIAVSRECGDRLAQRLPYRSADIATLPYGVQVPGELVRGYQASPLRLVYAGRVTQLQKRVLDFIPLVEQLLQMNVPFVFDIVGEGEHFDSLRADMQRRFPPDRIRFHPRVAHAAMPAIWSAHDVFLQVSDFEGTSVSMLEAMAHGVVPVVTAASSGIDGVIQHGQNGFVVPVGDMAAMAQVLARLAGDEARLATVGRAAHALARTYSITAYGERFTQLLDQAFGAHDRIDLRQRYGFFGESHPVFRQREQIARLQQGPLRRWLRARRA